MLQPAPSSFQLLFFNQYNELAGGKWVRVVRQIPVWDRTGVVREQMSCRRVFYIKLTVRVESSKGSSKLLTNTPLNENTFFTELKDSFGMMARRFLNILWYSKCKSYRHDTLKFNLPYSPFWTLDNQNHQIKPWFAPFVNFCDVNVLTWHHWPWCCKGKCSSQPYNTVPPTRSSSSKWTEGYK